jgi:two-component system, cell cycle response regulator
MKKAKIIIIEDDAGWREVIKDTLKDEGFVVEIATSTEEGLNAIKMSSYQLIIMDLNLQDQDEKNREGLKLLSFVGMFNPCARTVVLTAFPQHLREAFRASYGVYDYILKQDFDESLFLKDVKDAIQEAFECEQGRTERPAYPDYI